MPLESEYCIVRFIAVRVLVARDGKERFLIADPSRTLCIVGEMVPVVSFKCEHTLVIKWQPLNKIYLVYAQ